MNKATVDYHNREEMEAAGRHSETASWLSARKMMRHYLEERTNKIFRWRRRRKTTIVSTLNEDIKETKEDDITFPVTHLVLQVSLQNLFTKAKNGKLWSKMVQQVVKSVYSRWSRWSMPHSDWEEKRIRDIT